MPGRNSFVRQLALCGLFLSTSLPARAQDDKLEKLKAKPITTVSGKVGDLLRQWWKEGTAAGNVGDFYDNRDRDHSPLDLGQFPQLQRIVYPAEDLKVRKDWAGQRVIVPGVVFGNSSTSAPPRQGGSNVRMYYTNPNGLAFLYKQYAGNNVYIYPEHRDHDPGHNGRGDGFGDLYPTNTPYLFTSQGSSGSDQSHMRAIPLTLAAFRPDVKKKLTEAGLLMPTLQMIFRSTYAPPSEHGKPRNEKDYLTAKAHPTVFEPGWVNELGMVQFAHELRLESLPPMMQMRVDSEDQPLLGRDFFDVHRTERLADTPAVIARIFRGKDRDRKMVVNAAESYDLNKKPLTFTWVVLRGDPERIKILPRNKDQSEVEIRVSYHERRPIAVGSPMESNRVDIGVFANNGTHWSAPGFVTFYSLDDEARTYDDKGRILEIGYGMGETVFNVTNWNAFLTVATADRGVPANLLALTAEERQTLQKGLFLHKKLHEVFETARQKFKTADETRKQAKTDETQARKDKDAAEKAHQDKASATTKSALDKAAELLVQKAEASKQAEKLAQAAQRDLDAAAQAIRDMLDGKTKELPVSVQTLVDRHLHALSQDPKLFDLLSLTPGKEAPVNQAREKLIDLGVLSRNVKFGFTPLRPGEPPNWTAFEKNQIERCNAAILTSVLFPGSLDYSYDVNFVDQRVTIPRAWRDVYHNDAKGIYRGWTRYEGKEPRHFTADGYLILKTDPQDRPLEARTVEYRVMGNALRMIPGDTIITFEYAGPEDRQGTVKSKRPAPAE